MPFVAVELISPDGQTTRVAETPERFQQLLFEGWEFGRDYEEPPVDRETTTAKLADIDDAVEFERIRNDTRYAQIDPFTGRVDFSQLPPYPTGTGSPGSGDGSGSGGVDSFQLSLAVGAGVNEAKAYTDAKTWDAAKITSGTLSLTRIPVLDAGRVPNLDAAKITTGEFSATRIPVLDAAKINTGTFDAARIPILDAAKIGTGTLALARMPALDATRIPALDASKITTGVIDAARLPPVTATPSLDFSNRGVNIAVNPGFETGEFAPHSTIVGPSVGGKGGPRSGQYSGSIIFNSSAGANDFFIVNGNNPKPYPVFGETYRVEIWARALVGSMSTQAFIKTRDEAGLAVQSAYSVAVTADNSGWKKFTVDLTINSYQGVTIYAGLAAPSGWSSGTSLRIDDIMFRQVLEGSGSGQSADVTGLIAQQNQLMAVAVTTDELAQACYIPGRWNGFTSLEALSAAGATVYHTLWIAPFLCDVVSLDLVRDYTDIAANATNYMTLELRRVSPDGTGATVIATKTTKPDASGQAFPADTTWSFDGTSFNSAAKRLDKGYLLKLRVTGAGTATLRYPMTATWRYVPA